MKTTYYWKTKKAPMHRRKENKAVVVEMQCRMFPRTLGITTVIWH
jgi:hypothetical protein